MKCEKCGYYIMNKDAEFCPECREPTENYINDRRKDDRKEDEDDEGGFLDSIGNVLGKLFGG
jgi:hypothetical protein